MNEKYAKDAGHRINKEQGVLSGDLLRLPCRLKPIHGSQQAKLCKGTVFNQIGIQLLCVTAMKRTGGSFFTLYPSYRGIIHSTCVPNFNADQNIPNLG